MVDRNWRFDSFESDVFACICIVGFNVHKSNSE